MDTTTDKIKGKLAKLPDSPGVYSMLDADGHVLYVGKARSLRNRVRSYFQGSDLTPKTRSLVARVNDLDVIVTDSEVEALLLENNLIKEHRPRFNVTFRDDKQYMYLRITTGETYPRIAATRRLVKDGSTYFGPFTSAKSLRQTLKLLNRLFPYRTCNIDMARPIPRPCLKYHIGLCIAPCTRYCTPQEYKSAVAGALRFLQGDYEHVLAQITQQMWSAARETDYEAAAKHRDRIKAIEKVVADQKITDLRGGQLDAIAAARDGREAYASVFRIRSGKMVGRENYELSVTGHENNAELLDDFVREYYSRAPETPKLVLLPESLTDTSMVAEWLSSVRGSAVELRVPRRGQKRRLVEMAVRNARETLQLEQTTWLNSTRKLRQALLEIGTALDLPNLPRRIECYDISHIQGSLVVGSMVVFEDGIARKGEYRRFKVRGTEGNNDFAAMQEVLRRRFKRYATELAKLRTTGSHQRPLNSGVLTNIDLSTFNPDITLPGSSEKVAGSNKEWGVKPDLVLIDGGKGQLNAVRKALGNLDLDRNDLPLAAIAKKREEIFLPGQAAPILMPHDSRGLHLIQRIRDEAHRFAVSFHIKLRSKRDRRSILDEIPTIGPKRKRALLRAFGSVEAIREASIEDLESVGSMTHSSAKGLKEAL